MTKTGMLSRKRGRIGRMRRSSKAINMSTKRSTITPTGKARPVKTDTAVKAVKEEKGQVASYVEVTTLRVSAPKQKGKWVSPPRD